MADQVIDMTPLPSRPRKVHWSQRELSKKEVTTLQLNCRKAMGKDNEWQNTAHLEHLTRQAATHGITLVF